MEKLNLGQWLFGLANLLIGAGITWLADRRRFRRDQASRVKSTEAALAAEVHANLTVALGDDLDQVLWVLRRRENQHRLSHKIRTHKDIYNKAIGSLGDFAPSLAAQIIYFYARLDKLRDDFDELKDWFDGKIKIDGGEVGDPYAQVEAIINLVQELRADGMALVRFLNGGVYLGEGDVSFRIRPAEQEAIVDRLLAVDARIPIWERRRILAKAWLMEKLRPISRWR